ncbi:hypothetical protein FS749_004535 [Ceratobasidium sp. UAMH 11750]|nr:hypothetical protein FS749_004535 [Ceratobasidium sp. UAMH 11750]
MCKLLLRYTVVVYLVLSVATVTLRMLGALGWYSWFTGSVGKPLGSLTWESRSVAHHASGIRLDNELLLSKAFSSGLKPTKIIPYYYRALHEHERDDVMVTTIVTSNRFEALARLVKQYQGPISVAIHITSIPHSRQTFLIEALHSIYTSSALFPRWVDVHLVIDTHDRQFNLWRNVARLYARTAWVMMLDVDFVVCTDVRGRFRRALSAGETAGDEGNIGALARSGRAAFVVPAFEYVIQEDGKDWRAFPKDKKGLMDLVKAGKIEMFHRSWAPGHNSTSYGQYYAAQPGEVYRVDTYQKSYEPYVITQRDGPPWCDERFVGYGGNKAACLFSIYISGIDFYVLPDDFLIHQSHAYAEETRKNERKSNRQVYDDFRKEICLEQIAQSMRSNTLYTDAKSNLREECMKTPGVSEAVLERLKEY